MTHSAINIGIIMSEASTIHPQVILSLSSHNNNDDNNDKDIDNDNTQFMVSASQLEVLHKQLHDMNSALNALR